LFVLEAHPKSDHLCSGVNPVSARESRVTVLVWQKPSLNSHVKKKP